MLNLNDVNEITLADPDGYLTILENTPKLCRQIWEQFKTKEYHFAPYEKIVICAMGGSAIGADMAKYVIEKNTKLPIQIVRDYDLPNWVDQKTLAIVISYSGNTEETLSGYLQAMVKQAQILVIASGGKLLEVAVQNKHQYFELPTSLPPRTAWGLSFYVVLELLVKTKVLSAGRVGLEQSFDKMEKMIVENNPNLEIQDCISKQIAQSLTGSIPIVFGAGHLAAVARRWKGEFNENSKIPSFYEEIPELNHNLQQGLECSKNFKDSMTILILNSELYHLRNQKRAAIIHETFIKQEFDVITVQVGGATYAESIAGAVMLGDYVSVYLAFLLGKNPILYEAIEELKGMLKTGEYIDELLHS